MYNFIKKNQKKMLAIFGVLLMVIFILPSTYKNSATRHERVIGHVGKTPIYSEERSQAEERLATLMRGGGYLRYWMGEQLGPVLMRELTGDPRLQTTGHPELFMLLELEAKAHEITASEDEVNTVLRSTDDPNLSPDANTAVVNRYRDAIRTVLMIHTLRERLASAAKVTEPMWLHTLARYQKARLDLVELSAAQFKGSVPAPTTQAVNEQYERYSHSRSTTQPGSLGFGYEQPDRLQLQYVEIPRQQIMDAVARRQEPYDWEVAARQYYYNHLDEFPVPKPPASQSSTATQPGATQPTASTTGPATAPSQAQATLPAPTTRPFVEVQEQILAKVRQPEADALQAKVVDALQKRLNAGYETAGPATRPSTQPSGGPTTAPASGGYASKAWLDQLALEIQHEDGVLPVVQQIGEWQDADQLAHLPGISQSRTSDGVPFAGYAGSSKPFSAGQAGKGLEVLQPSTPLKDAPNNTYIFRLTAASPAQPLPLKDILPTVQTDALTRQAYEKAVDLGKKIVEQAKKGGLAAAASSQEMKVTSTGAFEPQGPDPLPGYEATPELARAIKQRVGQMLVDATSDKPHPVALVEVPSDRRVLVLELAGVAPIVSPERLWREQLEAVQQDEAQMREMLVRDWFSYDAIANRLQYRSDEPAKPS